MTFEALIPVLVALVGSLVPFYVASRESRIKEEQSEQAARVSHVQEVQAILKSQIDDKTAEINKLEARITFLQEENDRHRNLISNLRDQVDSLRRENHILQMKLDRLPIDSSPPQPLS